VGDASTTKAVELTVEEYNKLVNSDCELIDIYLKENMRTSLWRHKQTGELEERIGLHPPDELLVISKPNKVVEEKPRRMSRVRRKWCIKP